MEIKYKYFKFLLALAFLFFLTLIPLRFASATVQCSTCENACAGIIYYTRKNCGTGTGVSCSACCTNTCVKNSCDANCAVNGDCTLTCSGTTRYWGGYCINTGGAGSCKCGYSSEDCATKAGVCTSVSNYRDYVSCSGGACTYNDYDSDLGQAYCDTCKGAGYWNLGGETSATTCCEDASENKLTRTCTSGCTTSSSDDGCCSASTDCIYASTCYDTGWTGPAPWNASYTATCTNASWSLYQLAQEHFRWRNDDGSEINASWKANQDNIFSGQAKSQNLRLRLSIKNTAAAASNYLYQLQTTTRAGYYSCGIVPSASYSDVPTTSGAGCGSSIACMTTSTNFADGDATTQQLTSEGTFTVGKMVEDPSNKTGAITINQNYFTEVEYNFQFTTNASSNTHYCFRVTNAGAPLDFYTQVADIKTATLGLLIRLKGLIRFLGRIRFR